MSSPRGSSSRSPAPTLARSCRRRLAACERAGAAIPVPAVACGEVSGEIERRAATGQRRRLTR